MIGAGLAEWSKALGLKQSYACSEGAAQGHSWETQCRRAYTGSTPVPRN